MTESDDAATCKGILGHCTVARSRRRSCRRRCSCCVWWRGAAALLEVIGALLPAAPSGRNRRPASRSSVLLAARCSPGWCWLSRASASASCRPARPCSAWRCSRRLVLYPLGLAPESHRRRPAGLAAHRGAAVGGPRLVLARLRQHLARRARCAARARRRDQRRAICCCRWRWSSSCCRNLDACTCTSWASRAPSWGAWRRSPRPRDFASPARICNVYPPMSDQLAALGIDFIQGYGAEQLDLAARHRGRRQRAEPRQSGGRSDARSRHGVHVGTAMAGRAGAQGQARARGGGHPRQDHDLEHAGLDPGACGPRARIPDRRRAEQFRCDRAAWRIGRVLRDRGRRVRHGVLRQAREVRALPAAHRDPQQSGIRSRRHLSGRCLDPPAIQPVAAHRARGRAASSRMATTPSLRPRSRQGCWTPRESSA